MAFYCRTPKVRFLCKISHIHKEDLSLSPSIPPPFQSPTKYCCFTTLSVFHFSSTITDERRCCLFGCRCPLNQVMSKLWEIAAGFTKQICQYQSFCSMLLLLLLLFDLKAHVVPLTHGRPHLSIFFYSRIIIKKPLVELNL